LFGAARNLLDSLGRERIARGKRRWCAPRTFDSCWLAPCCAMTCAKDPPAGAAVSPAWFVGNRI